MVSERACFRPLILISCWFYHHEEHWMQHSLPSLRSLFFGAFVWDRALPAEVLDFDPVNLLRSVLDALLAAFGLVTFDFAIFTLLNVIYFGFRWRGNKNQNNLTQCVWGLFALALIALFFWRSGIRFLPALCRIIVLRTGCFPVIGIRSLFIVVWCRWCWHFITSPLLIFK